MNRVPQEHPHRQRTRHRGSGARLRRRGRRRAEVDPVARGKRQRARARSCAASLFSSVAAMLWRSCWDGIHRAGFAPDGPAPASTEPLRPPREKSGKYTWSCAGTRQSRERSIETPTASPALAPKLFAGLHEATSLRWPAWRFRIRSRVFYGATSPGCATCWTGRCRRASEASGRSPTASVKRSISAMGAAGGSARAAAGRCRTCRRPATSRCLRVSRLAALGAGRGVLPHPVAPAVDVPGTVDEVGGLTLVLVETGEQRRVWNTLMGARAPARRRAVCRPATAVSGGFGAWLAGRGRVRGECAAAAGPRRLGRVGRYGPSRPPAPGVGTVPAAGAPRRCVPQPGLPRAGPGRPGGRRRLRASVRLSPLAAGNVRRRDRTDGGERARGELRAKASKQARQGPPGGARRRGDTALPASGAALPRRRAGRTVGRPCARGTAAAPDRAAAVVPADHAAGDQRRRRHAHPAMVRPALAYRRILPGAQVRLQGRRVAAPHGRAAQTAWPSRWSSGGGSS